MNLKMNSLDHPCTCVFPWLKLEGIGFRCPKAADPSIHKRVQPGKQPMLAKFELDSGWDLPNQTSIRTIERIRLDRRTHNSK